jgi:undecaprenyl pyrophosphate synthase
LRRNWNRSPDEVRFLMGFNREVLRRRRDQLDWSDWSYDDHRGLIVLSRNRDVRLPYNHLLFTVVRHREE